ncbi:aspartate--tRNA ligase [Patescibacteria group bacterium]|nr:aspartate--tRNA ligase [Patescibacteria group bacterium]
MERTLIAQTPEKIGQKVRLCGWVNTRRDHGKMVFIDLRDRSGLVQIVGDEKLGKLRSEFVVEIEGLVKKRPQNMINEKISTGKIEIDVEKMTVLGESKELPFPLETDGYEINEELRLKYRYLDLRRQRLIKNLEIRHQVIKYIRDFLDKLGFIEVETPILSKATPEGARDFIVPSRLQRGKFYALPQSPQQYKQLLMVAGLEKYYQIARCFRDEDPRADRAYGEFTQLDLEMSFVSQEEILVLTENLYKEIAEKILGKKVYQFPFPRLSYDEVMKKYGTDNPDLRPDKKDKDLLAFCFIKDFPLFEWKKSENRWDSMHHPFTAPKKEEINLLDTKPGEVHSYQHDFVLNGYEIGGGSMRISDSKIQEKIFEILGHSKQQIQEKFGHLFKAFEYGVPPHGGIAPGIDRFLMVVLNEQSLREVMAFPMTSGGQTSVMEAPSEVDEEQLKELGIEFISKKNKNVSQGRKK